MTSFIKYLNCIYAKYILPDVDLCIIIQFRLQNEDAYWKKYSFSFSTIIFIVSSEIDHKLYISKSWSRVFINSDVLTIIQIKCFSIYIYHWIQLTHNLIIFTFLTYALRLWSLNSQLAHFVRIDFLVSYNIKMEHRNHCIQQINMLCCIQP